MFRILITILTILHFLPTWAQENEAILVNQETNIEVKNGKLYKTVVYELKIFNRAGEKHAKITIPYSKLIHVSKIEAYIKDKNGSIVKKLKNNEIKDRSAISEVSFYEDHFVKEFTLKHNTYPYSVCYSYQVQQDEFLYIDYWLPVIDRQIPTLKASLHVEIPEEYKIRYRNQSNNEVEIDTSDSKIKYTWNVSYIDVLKPDLYSPSIQNFLPSVIIVPQNFIYDLEGSFKSWSTFGDWQYELLQGLSDLPLNERNKILSLIDGNEDKKEKIKKLYHYLQDETRYINITIETGGLKPYPASYVAVNKYGDCKALTNYFKSVLDVIGIQSYYTIVYAGSPIKEINRNLPSQQFNHVILCVPVQNDTIWIDCTSDGPFGHLGTFTQNREVFIIEKNNSHFTRTPALSCQDVLETRTIRFFPKQDNNMTASFSNTFRGETYALLYYLYHSFDESTKEQIIRNRFIEEGFEVTGFNLVEAHKDSSKIHLFFTARTNRIYNRYGNEILIKLLPFSLPQFEIPMNRTLPVQLDYPIYKIDSIEYIIPVGYNISNQLNNHTVISEFGQYKIEFHKQGNKVKVVKSFLLKSGYYPIETFKNLYDFIHSVEEIENNTYIVTTRKIKP